jgi:pyruvate/2-oxoglutarate/acetoin dehydrogenase E1 component
MFGGQANFPVTYRCTTGGGIGLAAQHSQSPYSMWEIAGLLARPPRRFAA